MKKSNSEDFLVQIISTNEKIRSQTIISELNRQKISFKYTPGVVPTKAEFQQGLLHDKILTNLLAQRDLTSGEVGCALAHKTAAMNLLTSNFKFGLTFEDDAEVLQDFKFELLAKNLISAFPTVINLGWIPGYAVAYEKSWQQNNELLRVVTPPTCAFAYAFNRPAAELIALHDKKVIDLADWPINMLTTTNFFIVNPAWVTAPQDPNQSIIGIRIEEQKLSKLKAYLKKLKFLTSFLKLLILSRFMKPRFSVKQVIHRFIIRDLIYRYGIKQLEVSENPRVENTVVFSSSVLGKSCRIFKI